MSPTKRPMVTARSGKATLLRAQLVAAVANGARVLVVCPDGEHVVEPYDVARAAAYPWTKQAAPRGVEG